MSLREDVAFTHESRRAPRRNDPTAAYVRLAKITLLRRKSVYWPRFQTYAGSRATQFTACLPALCYASAMATSVVRLTHLTDPHLYGSEGERLRGIATLPALEATLANAQRHDWPPDAVLVTGDLVQDDPAGYATFPAPARRTANCPCSACRAITMSPEAMRRELDCAAVRHRGIGRPGPLAHRAARQHDCRLGCRTPRAPRA